MLFTNTVTSAYQIFIIALKKKVKVRQNQYNHIRTYSRLVRAQRKLILVSDVLNQQSATAVFKRTRTKARWCLSQSVTEIYSCLITLPILLAVSYSHTIRCARVTYGHNSDIIRCRCISWSCGIARGLLLAEIIFQRLYSNIIVRCGNDIRVRSCQCVVGFGTIHIVFTFSH